MGPGFAIAAVCCVQPDPSCADEAVLSGLLYDDPVPIYATDAKRMAKIQKITLDVLKPHRPNALEFASAVADLSRGMRVEVTVEAVDERTENVLLEISGGDIDFDAISRRIAELGGSVHSIDMVEVVGAAPTAADSA
jgi:hypothetical protein